MAGVIGISLGIANITGLLGIAMYFFCFSTGLLLCFGLNRFLVGTAGISYIYVSKYLEVEDEDYSSFDILSEGFVISAFVFVVDYNSSILIFPFGF